MYSMVLMMALNSGAAAPAGLFDHGCNGCCGGNACCGAPVCSSSCCGGWSGHGCCGGHGLGLSGLFHHNSCCGGWSCNGCCGGGHVVSYNCCGGSACCGGGHGGHFSGLFHRHGCCGGSGCWASCTGCAGCAAPAAPGAPAPAPKSEPVPAPKKADASDSAGEPAKIVVSLPADAKLTIDDEATTSTSGQRTFVTPALEAGQDYIYNLKAEITRDGTTFNVTQRVTVRAGEETKANLQFPVETAAK